MERSYIRSYRIVDPGDVEVIDRRGGELVNLSAHYEGVPRERNQLRIEVSLDVFRFEDGQYAWSASSNGQDTESATSLALVLGLYLEDLLGGASTPRSL